MSPQVRLVYLILVQNLANFAFFAVQATARVDVQLLTVADQEQIVEVIKVIDSAGTRAGTRRGADRGCATDPGTRC